MALRAALILHRFDLRRGGAERSTLEMAASLCALGAEVTVVAGSIAALEGSWPFNQLALPCRGWTRAGRQKDFARQVSDLAHSGRFDILHSLTPMPGIHVYQPRGGSVGFGWQRHVASFQGAGLRTFKEMTGGWNRARHRLIEAEKALCQRPQGPTVAAVSRYVQMQFRDLYGLGDDRLRLIPNGVDPAPWRSEEARAKGQKLRYLYDRRGELALWVFAAANFRLKGLRELLLAARIAHQRRTTERDFRLFVVGTENYRRYWQMACEGSLREQVLFMGGTSEMPALLSMADGVILPTYHDACSRLVLESLAAGKPAITTACNGAAEFLGEGRYGLTVPSPTATEELAGAIRQLNDPERHRQMCRDIETDRVYEKVSMQRHARDLLRLYEEMVRQRAGGKDQGA